MILDITLMLNTVQNNFLIYVCRKGMNIFNEFHTFETINDKTICSLDVTMEAFFFFLNFIHLYYDFKGTYYTSKGKYIDNGIKLSSYIFLKTFQRSDKKK